MKFKEHLSKTHQEKREKLWKEIEKKVNIIRNFIDLIFSFDFETSTEEIERKLNDFFEDMQNRFPSEMRKEFQKCKELLDEREKLLEELRQYYEVSDEKTMILLLIALKSKRDKKSKKAKDLMEKIIDIRIKLEDFLKNSDITFIIYLYLIIKNLKEKNQKVKEIYEKYQTTGELEYLPLKVQKKLEILKKGIVDIIFEPFTVIILLKPDVWQSVYKKRQGVYYHDSPYALVKFQKDVKDISGIIGHERIHNLLEGITKIKTGDIGYFENVEMFLDKINQDLDALETLGIGTTFLKERIKKKIKQLINAVHYEIVANLHRIIKDLVTFLESLDNQKIDKRVLKRIVYLSGTGKYLIKFMIELSERINRIDSRFANDELKRESLKKFYNEIKKIIKSDLLKTVINLLEMVDFISSTKDEKKAQELLITSLILALIFKPTQYHHILEYLKREIEQDTQTYSKEKE